MAASTPTVLLPQPGMPIDVYKRQGKSRSIRLKADCAVGDWVKVELPDGQFVSATAIAYALPLACFLMGLFLGLSLIHI